MPDAEQEIAIVTGGAGGIGRAICERLAADGFYTCVCARRSRTRAEEIVDGIRVRGGAGEVVMFDVADATGATKALQPLLQGPRKLRVVVHAAAITTRALVLQTPTAALDAVLQTNLNSFFYVSRPLLKEMIRARSGAIVAVSSIIAERGLEAQAPYAASKAGLIGAVRSLAREVGPYNITVNIVAPGWIGAGMNDGGPPENVLQRIPLRRPGTPNEIASVVSFLCSPDAAYITGAVVPVSGGLDV